MPTISTDSPVMITGATGYVAGWIVKKLLEAGVTIHAAVRNPDDPQKIDYLKKLADASPGQIRFFKADLLDEGSYADAMADCSIVFHTASPFTNDVKDPQKELVDPAKLGTRNVLEEVNRTPAVRRVVLTSSCAAIYGDNADVAAAPGGVLTEEVWNTTSSLTHQPYSYSKTEAEREAWRIANAQSHWQMAVINPSLVLGPGIKMHGGESFHIMQQMGDGTMRSGAPRWGMGVVDVRDLADAHIAAGFNPELKGRHIVSGTDTDMLEIALSLRERYGDEFPIPAKAAPKFLLWLIGPFVSKLMTRKAVSRNVNIPWKSDNSKSIRELGISYLPLAKTTQDMFQQMVNAGAFKK